MSKRPPESEPISSEGKKRKTDGNRQLEVGSAPARKVLSSDYTVGWICAIGTEYIAAQEFLDEEHEGLEHVSPNDNNNYTLGRIGQHNVVIAVLPDGEYGIASAANVATSMLHSFPSIRIGLMVGVGGGAPSEKHDIRLGDVVVSAPSGREAGVFQYDFGKTIQNQGFRHTRFLNQPPLVLRGAIAGVQAHYKRKGHLLEETIREILKKNPRLQREYRRPHESTDRLFKAEVSHNPKGCAEFCAMNQSDLITRHKRTEFEDNPAVHYGLIASANQLMRDATVRDRLAAEKDVLCFEMEAAGLMNQFPCLVIWGICDYSDSHKNNEWQGYAAMVAAAYARDLLSRITPSKVKAEEKLTTLLSDVSSTVAGTKEKLEAISANQDKQIDFEILNWLTPMDYGLQHSTLLKKRQPGTGRWLLDSIPFQTWLTTNRQTLFCPGLPGTGKTIITSIVVDSLINRLENKLEIGLAYLYCSFWQREEQKVEDLVASLLKQLSHRQGSLPSHLRDLHKHHKKEGTRPLLEEMLSSLRKVVATYHSVFIVIDALDECQPLNACRSKLLSEVFRLQDAYGVNIFATSRTNEEINSLFSNAIHLQIRAIDDDLRVYLHERVKLQKSEILKDSILETVVSEIIKSADGMFLLAEFHINSLIHLPTVGDIKLALQNLAKGTDRLDQTYEQAIERIESQERGHRELAWQVLSWIVHSKRPISTTELKHALAVRPHLSELDNDFFLTDEIMQSVCAGLVTVDGRSNSLCLAHYTAQEYFERTKKNWFPNAENEIADTCLTYLCLEDFRSGPCHTDHEFQQRLQTYQLYHYAAQNWGHHAREATTAFHKVMQFLNCEAELRASIQAFHMVKGSSSDNPFSLKVPKNLGSLHLAAHFGLDQAAHRLLQDGHNPNVMDSSGRTPLWWAVDSGQDNVVKLLLNDSLSKANLSDRDLGRTPLSWAIEKGKRSIIELLLNSDKVEVNAGDENGWTPLWWATDKEDSAVVKLLLGNERVDANCEDSTGQQLLCHVVKEGRVAMVKLLVTSERVNANARDAFGQTPLWWAVKTRRDMIIRIMLASTRVDANARHDKRWTPLWLAFDNYFWDIMPVFLASDHVDPNARDERGRSLLSYSAYKWRPNRIEKLLDSERVDPNSKDQDGRTPIWWAVEGGKANNVKLLLECGKVDPDIKVHSLTPLWLAIEKAIENDDTRIIKILLGSEKVDPNAKNQDGETPILCAVKENKKNIVELLLESERVDVNMGDMAGWTPLSHAALQGNESLVKLLLECEQIYPDVGDGSGGTPLWWAVTRGHHKVVKLLLEDDRVKFDSKDLDWGRTPLSHASGDGCEEIVQLLLEKKADIFSEDFFGRTPLWWATTYQHEKVIKLLHNAVLALRHVHNPSFSFAKNVENRYI